MKKQIFFFCFCALLFSCNKQDENRPGRYAINADGDVLDTHTGRVYYNWGNGRIKYTDFVTPDAEPFHK